MELSFHNAVVSIIIIIIVSHLWREWYLKYFTSPNSELIFTLGGGDAPHHTALKKLFNIKIIFGIFPKNKTIKISFLQALIFWITLYKRVSESLWIENAWENEHDCAHNSHWIQGRLQFFLIYKNTGYMRRLDELDNYIILF